MSKQEHAIEQTVVNRAKAQGYRVYKLRFDGVNGAPDRLFCRGGLSILIEFKDRGKKAEAHQEQVHRRLREEGGLAVHVCDSVADAEDILGL